MRNPNSPNDGMMPFPGMGPMMVIRDNNQPHNPNPMNEPQEPPLRVRVALGYLQMLNNKQRTQIGGCQDKVEGFDGLKPTPEEDATRSTVCAMLDMYFNCKLVPDKWEEQQFAAVTPVLEFNCVCNGSNDDCPFCGGTGLMEIVAKKSSAITNPETHVLANTPQTPVTPPAPNRPIRKTPPR